MYKIMVVDDEKAIRENLSKALNFEEAGFEIIATAINGQDALDKLSLYKPDVIFLDCQRLISIWC